MLLAGGKTPEDLAADAILKVLGGDRVWDPGRGPLLPYLEGVVDSLISHLAASADNRIQERWSEAHDAADASRRRLTLTAHRSPARRADRRSTAGFAGRR